MGTRKIIPLSKLVRNPETDTVAFRQAMLGSKSNQSLLNKCAISWQNSDKIRKDRARALRYTYGDQLSDYVTYKGRTITEKSYIQSKGNTPLVNNLIRRLVNTMVGAYTKDQVEPVCYARDRDEQKLGEMMTMTLQCNWQINKMADNIALLFEDFVIGASIFARETFEFREDKFDSWTDVCNVNYMFWDSEMKSPTHKDLSMIGEIHDIPFLKLCSIFAKDPKQFERLRALYSAQANIHTTQMIDEISERHKERYVEFITPRDPSMCRVYEIWTKELKPRYRCHDPLEARLYKIETEKLPLIHAENETRKKEGLEQGIPMKEIPLIKTVFFYDSYWYYQFLTPNGIVLDEGETPYKHRSHPYTMRLYPFINGEVHSPVMDVIDQQRYINRMITLNDFVIRTSAKGVLLVPEESIPDSMTPEQFAEQWTSVDGVVIFNPKNGDSTSVPKQIANNMTNIGTSEMIQLQMKLMEDVSGVHSAIQGKTSYSGTSAALYAQQTANSSASLTNLFQRFSSFIEDVAIKKVKTMQQFYTEKRVINIVGKDYLGIKEYDPELASNVDFDLSIKESTSTPVYRMVANDMLMNFWEKGAITIEMLLENADMPFGERLLQSIQSAKESQQQGEAPQGAEISPELQEEMKKGVNQEQLGQAQNMLSQ